MHQTLKTHKVVQITTKQKSITSQSGYGGLVTVHQLTQLQTVFTLMHYQVLLHSVDLLHQLVVHLQTELMEVYHHQQLNMLDMWITSVTQKLKMYHS